MAELGCAEQLARAMADSHRYVGRQPVSDRLLHARQVLPNGSGRSGWQDGCADAFDASGDEPAWRQRLLSLNEEAVRDPRAGDKIVIKRGPLGSYLLRIGSNRAVKGKRVG